jgi:hypothetical protein
MRRNILFYRIVRYESGNIAISFVNAKSLNRFYKKESSVEKLFAQLRDEGWELKEIA